MVEYSLDFDAIFGALSDKNRRHMLVELLRGDLTISELARDYTMTFAGVAKHLDVLVRAGLVYKRRKGREQIVSAQLEAVKRTAALLQEYEGMWVERFSRLEDFLAQEE